MSENQGTQPREQGSKPRISFEFFPPKTDQGFEKLSVERAKLAEHKPEFFSVTYGAGGSTRDHTFDLVVETHKATSISTAPHLSCIGDTRAALSELILKYQSLGIERIVALRGDLPSGTPAKGELPYAKDLVALIRELTGDHFLVEVAAYPEMHPQAENMQKDFAHFKEKVDQGANSAITQYFYSVDAYRYFLDACEKAQINIPIIPGIMPITNYTKLARFSDMCGAEIPRWIAKRLQSYGDDTASIAAFGEDVVTHMLEQLIGLGIPGIHFYTLNQADPSLAICQNLNLV